MVAISQAGDIFIEYVIVAAVAVALILGVIQAFFGSVAALWSRLASMITGAA